MFDHIKQSLHEFGTNFDVYTHELDAPAAGSNAIARLRETGNIYEKDGATWFRAPAHLVTTGPRRDQSDGKPAYIAGDLALLLGQTPTRF